MDGNIATHRVQDLKDLYDEKYYHGYAYEDYTFDRLRHIFLQTIRHVDRFCGKKGRLLDVGCALGFFVKVALKEGFDAYGVDISEYAVKEGRKILGDRIRWADVEVDIPFEEGFFDIITAWDVLEHLEQPARFLKRCRKALKVKGFLFITTVNYNSLMSRLMKETRERWRLIAPDYHLTYTITPTGLKDWLNEAGLQEIYLKSFSVVNKDIGPWSRTKDLYIHFTSTTARRIANIVEKSLNSGVELLSNILKPLYLGTYLTCVARRVI